MLNVYVVFVRASHEKRWLHKVPRILSGCLLRCPPNAARNTHSLDASTPLSVNPTIDAPEQYFDKSIRTERTPEFGKGRCVHDVADAVLVGELVVEFPQEPSRVRIVSNLDELDAQLRKI